MPSFELSTDTIHTLKRLARGQFPQIGNSHLLEALSRGLGFETWAALNCAIKNTSTPVCAAVTFQPALMQARLVELGHPDAAAQPLQLTLQPVFGAGAPPTPARNDGMDKLTALVRRGVLTPEQHTKIRHLVTNSPCRILIAGAVGSGKTAFMGAVLDALARRHAASRFGLIQPSGEFKNLPTNVRRVSSREGRPVRVNDPRIHTYCIDELRDPVAAAMMLRSWQASRYGVATLHAGPGFALNRVELLSNLPKAQLSQAIDACIYMENIRGNKTGRPAVHAIHIVNSAR